MKSDLEIDQMVKGRGRALLGTPRVPVNKPGGVGRGSNAYILLWGIPTLFVVVGGGWWLMHMHH